MRAHQVILQQYLRGLRVVTDDDFGPAEKYMIKQSKRLVEKFDLQYLSQRSPVKSRFAPGFDFYVDPERSVLLLVDPENSTIAAGIYNATPYCRPEYRGLGLGSAIVCFDETGNHGLLHPTSLSFEGFRARKSTHRRLVESALADPDSHVPDEVLDQYEMDTSGQLKLREPWTMDDQNELWNYLRNQWNWEGSYEDFLASKNVDQPTFV